MSGTDVIRRCSGVSWCMNHGTSRTANHSHLHQRMRPNESYFEKYRTSVVLLQISLEQSLMKKYRSWCFRATSIEHFKVPLLVPLLRMLNCGTHCFCQRAYSGYAAIIDGQLSVLQESDTNLFTTVTSLSRWTSRCIRHCLPCHDVKHTHILHQIRICAREGIQLHHQHIMFSARVARKWQLKTEHV